MGAPLQHITIVGGGTSGWLSACFLGRVLHDDIKAGRMRLTLIESPNIPIIGVGEASSPALRMMFQTIGLNETDFIRECDVAFKMSGFFSGWNIDDNGNPIDWINPFLTERDIAGHPPAYYYLKYGRLHGDEDAEPNFTRAISSCPDIIDQRVGPRKLNDKDYTTPFHYAYHMDAIKLAKQLRDLGVKFGVEHILDDVQEVKLDDRGFVSELMLAENGAHPIEFVIDCTGFRGVIMNKALGEPFDPFDKYLPNDRAAVVQTKHDDPDEFEPLSRATALSNGWSFRVPLYSRVGNGYVYSSDFISDEQAVDELKAHIGDKVKDADPRIIRMRIGKSRRSWVKNCLAMGLSSGFIEPLEATAIHSVDLALRWFYTCMPDSDMSPALQDHYNKLIDDLYEEMIDFIVLHFRLNNRTDSEYWRVAREEREIPDSLAHNLDLWRYKVPQETDLGSAHFFTSNNYTVALMSKGFYDEQSPNRFGLRRDDWSKYIRSRRKARTEVIAKYPNHVELLRHIRGENTAPERQFNVRLTV
ncbi:MAG: tryptophan halogenase family protein [Pseudomonadota bacterium]